MNLKRNFATLAILLTLWSFGYGGSPGGGGASSSSPLASALSALTNGQEPSIIPSTHVTKTKLTKKEAITANEKRIADAAAKKADLLCDKVARFRGKHLSESVNGVEKGKIDSYDALTPTSGKQHVVELDWKLVKGGILPRGDSDSDHFKKWVNDMGKTSVSIIDEDFDVLKEDIKTKFEEWVRNGKKIPSKVKWPLAYTDGQYKVTDLTKEPVRDANGVVVEVRVMAEQYLTRVELGFDENGNPVHFEKMHKDDMSDNKLQEKKNIGSFTTDELKQNAELKKKFLKDLEVPASWQNDLLNDQAQTFKDLVGKFDEDLQKEVIKPVSGACSSTVNGRRKRAAGGRSDCAIFLKPNGEVDAVHPKEFVDEYKKADGKGKEILANLAKNNVDKVAGPNDVTNQKKMKKLIQLEDMKSHVASVDAVKNVQSSKKATASQSFKNAVDSLSKKISGAKSKVKLSHSKMSAKFSKLANSKGAKGFASGVGAVSDPLGKYFLAKTVVNGIINGDTTSLAIVGARVGYEVVTESAVWTGAKFFKASSKVGKSAKYLGKVAGPVGAAADIGLSVWSLTKSVERLNSAKNQYERNDAIADIVSDSVDIAVTATVTVLSITFPPAAPVIIAVGAVIDVLNKLVTSIFKAANEVARINAEIPLLESEISYAFTSRFFDLFGTRQKDYLEFLIEEKAANDIVVQHKLMFLQENPAFGGIVFPSRTLAYEGGCRLTKQHCALKNVGGCTRWENIETVGSGCDWNRACGAWGTCTDHWEPVGDWGYDDFKCVCHFSKERFGEPRSNSLVDFRQKQKLYWERAVPKDVECAKFKCKPGSTSFQDYKLHQESSRSDYLCENAIALLSGVTVNSHKFTQKLSIFDLFKPNRGECTPFKIVGTINSSTKSQQIMLFDLEDGDDRVYLSSGDPTPNLFIVGNEGTKEFYGGSGKNEFLLNGNCTKQLRGTLSGGASQLDVLTVLKTCKNGEYLYMDFEKGQLSSQNGDLSMNIRNIEDLNGRENEGDYVVAGCNLRKVALRGGNARQPDLIKIPNSQCNYKLTVMTGSFSKIESEARQGDISVLLDMDWEGTTFDFKVYPKDSLKLNVFFLATASHEVSFGSLSTQGQMLLKVTLRNAQKSDEVVFHLNFQNISKPEDQNQAIYFTESPPNSPYSVLLLSLSSPPVFYHTLSDMGSTTGLKRIGNRDTENVFQITGPNWHSVGGEKADEFILNSAQITMIDGGGGDDTLRLHPDLKAPMVINLANNDGGCRLTKQHCALKNAGGCTRWEGVETVSSGCDWSRPCSTKWGICIDHTEPVGAWGYVDFRCVCDKNSTTSSGHPRRNSELKTRMVINLANNDMFKSIENVYGVPGNPVEIICGCDTKLVAPAGGSELPDLVIVPEESCAQRDLQIVAKGHSHVVISSGMGNDITKDKITLVAVVSDRFELETRSDSLAGLVVAIQISHKNWKAVQFTKSSNGESTIIQLEGNGKELIKFTLKDSKEGADNPYLAIPYIQISKSDSEEPSGQLIIEEETLIPKIFYQLNSEASIKNGENIIEGLSGIQNVFKISSGSWRAIGGNASDIFSVSSSAQSQITSVNGGDGGENILILETDAQQVTEGGTYGVNLETGQMGYLTATSKGEATNIHSVLGRMGLPDLIHASCTTKTVNGRKGGGKGMEDLVFISGKGCSSNQSLIQTTIVAEEFTKVINNAETGSFTYHVPDLLTAELELKSTLSNLHLVKFGFNPWEHIQKIAFDEKESILGIKVGQGETERAQFFKMFRKSKTEEYFNPVFEFHQPGTQVTADLLVGKDGAVAATFVVLGTGLGNGEEVRGLPVNVNRFLINITEPNGEEIAGSIRGDPKADANLFWLFNLENPLDALDGGACSSDVLSTCTNYLHFAETFEVGKGLEIYLSSEGGYVKSAGETMVSKLVNFHELRGRTEEKATEKVIVSTCNVKQLAAVEEILIVHSDRDDCEFNLIMEIDKTTQVWFEDKDSVNGSSLWVNSTFHYRFAEPTSFDLKGSNELAWLGPTHNYYLSFKIDDLESIWFDVEEEQIHYLIGGEEYYHSMISGTGFDDQFFTQPVLLTQDGFKIHVNRDGSILLGMGAGSSFPAERMRTEVIPAFEDAAKKLKLTIILQTDSQYIHAGHGNLEGDRNVLQNLGYSESRLLGGGADDTIYDIGDLSKDVFIYPGFDTETELEMSTEISNKQTLDLTDIVVPIRILSGTKYVPTIERKNDDLVIKMDGYEDKCPGKIWIVNGAMEQVANRVQLLLNNAIMHLVPIKTEGRKGNYKRSVSAPEDNTIEWKILPRPIEIPDDTVFSISTQDLEDGHEIRVANASTSSNATFNLAKNGTDLYLTNVLTAANGLNETQPKMEITTVIIADYFEDTMSVWEDDNFLNEDDDGKQNYTFPILPSAVLNVTVTLPGLSAVLNGSDVLQENEIGTKIDPMEVQHWKFLLYEAEEGILEGMSDIPRTFKCAECGINWLYYFGIITSSLLLLITLLVISNRIRRFRSSRRGEYDLDNEKYEKNVKVEQTNVEENITENNIDLREIKQIEE